MVEGYRVYICGVSLLVLFSEYLSLCLRRTLAELLIFVESCIYAVSR